MNDYEPKTLAVGGEKPAPGLRAICQLCGGTLISKCGNVKVWHWAHLTGQNCDAWAEPETDWHLRCKAAAAEFGMAEVVIGRHRADALVGNTVIEFQHSPITAEVITEREHYYREHVGGIVWVVDAERIVGNFSYRGKPGERVRFPWTHWRSCWAAAKAHLIFDCGDLPSVECLHIEPNRPWERSEIASGQEFVGGKPAMINGIILGAGCAVLRSLVIAGVDARAAAHVPGLTRQREDLAHAA